MMLEVLILIQKHLLLFLLIKTLTLYMLIIIGGYLIKEIIKIFLLYIMELPNPDLVVFKNALHKNKTENDIVNVILKKILLLGDDLKRYKFDGEFLLYICNLVEHLVGSNKFDKKKLVLNIVGSVFNLNLNETEVISNLIEFLHSNQLIKKVENKIESGFIKKMNTIFNLGEKKTLLEK